MKTAPTEAEAESSRSWRRSKVSVGTSTRSGSLATAALSLTSVSRYSAWSLVSSARMSSVTWSSPRSEITFSRERISLARMVSLCVFVMAGECTPRRTRESRPLGGHDSHGTQRRSAVGNNGSQPRATSPQMGQVAQMRRRPSSARSASTSPPPSTTPDLVRLPGPAVDREVVELADRFQVRCGVGPAVGHRNEVVHFGRLDVAAFGQTPGA